MELHHTNNRQTSNLPNVITGRLSDLACELTTMVESIKYGRLQFTSDEYDAMESASQDVAKIVNSIANEVKALGKRRKPSVVAEGQKLLSQAESAKLQLMACQKPRSQVVFVRNIQLFFNPPAESMLDSPSVQKRKKLTRERCERLRRLSPNKTVLWAAAFPPSTWDSNVLQKSTFDYVVEFLEPGNSVRWSAPVYEILNTLAVEQPLCHSSDFKEFLTGQYINPSWISVRSYSLAMQQSVEQSQNTTQSCTQLAQAQQSEVPNVDGNHPTDSFDILILTPGQKVHRKSLREHFLFHILSWTNSCGSILGLQPAIASSLLFPSRIAWRRLSFLYRVKMLFDSAMNHLYP